MALAGNINRRREALGLSQEALAYRADVSRPYITRVCGGQHDVGITNMVSIAHALETTPAALLEGVRA